MLNRERVRTTAVRRFAVNQTGGKTLSVVDLFAAYENADVVEFPSTYEKLGMPVVEANPVERVVVAGIYSAAPRS